MPFMNEGTSTWLDNVAPEAKEKILGEMAGQKAKADDNDTIYKEEDVEMKDDKEVTEDVTEATPEDVTEEKEDVATEEAEDVVADDATEDAQEKNEELPQVIQEVFAEIAEAMIKQEQRIKALQTKLEAIEEVNAAIEKAKETAPLFSFSSILDGARTKTKGESKSDTLAEDLLKETPTETVAEDFASSVSLLGI